MNLLEEDDLQPPQLDETKKYYEELVGEGRKFKDPEALARSKFEADSYIEILKRQKDELRADYLKMREETMAKAKLEELIDRHSKQLSGENKKPDDTAVKPLDPAELDRIFGEKINAYELANRQRVNLKTVKDKLIERFGKNYQSTVKEQIQDLGITEEVFNQMAQNYPQMVFKALEIDRPPQREDFPAPPRNSVNRPANKGETKRTWTYYQELKKTNPKLYLDPKTTNQMHKDYQELGTDFEDGDFKAYGM
jgi:hypothetical protein